MGAGTFHTIIWMMPPASSMDLWLTMSWAVMSFQWRQAYQTLFVFTTQITRAPSSTGMHAVMSGWPGSWCTE
jgi:hypothetical protein